MECTAVFPEPGLATSAPTPQTSARGAQAAFVSRDDIVRTVAPVGGDYRFSRPRLGGAEPVLEGDFETTALRPGLILHRTRVRDLHDMQTRLTLAPGLKIGLLVAGETEVSFGRLDLRLGPRRDAAGRLHNRGVLVALAEPDTFARRWRRGRSESKVSVTLQDDWLDGGAFAEGRALDRLREFRTRHLAHESWEPSPRALALAHQIAHPPALAAPFRHWYLEARTVEFAAEALMSLVREPAPAPTRLAAREHRRLRELLAWLDAHATEGLTLERIARQAAMSPAALQRAFRAFSGQPLFDYVRERRLDAARQALEREGVSVARAAEIAGYAAANNFATAFKRRFGCTPRASRLRV
jgi:AraC-like DNA-binding protein